MCRCLFEAPGLAAEWLSWYRKRVGININLFISIYLKQKEHLITIEYILSCFFFYGRVARVIVGSVSDYFVYGRPNNKEDGS